MSLKKLETELSVIKEVYEQKPPYKHVSGFYPFEAEDFLTLSAKPVGASTRHSFHEMTVVEEPVSISAAPKTAITASIIKILNVDEKETTQISARPVSSQITSIIKKSVNDNKETVNIKAVPKEVITKSVIVVKREDNRETITISATPKSSKTTQVK